MGEKMNRNCGRRRTIPISLGVSKQHASLMPFLCRCCLSSDVPLYRMNRDVSSLFTELTQIANFSNPHLNVICGYCLHFLRKMSRFRTQCNQANARFHTLLLWNNMNTENGIQSIDRCGMNTLSSSKIELISYTPRCPYARENLEVTEIIHIDIPAYVDIDIPNDCSDVSHQKPVQANLSIRVNNLMDIESKIPSNLIVPVEESILFRRSDTREKSETMTYYDRDIFARKYNPLVHNGVENKMPKKTFTRGIPLEKVISEGFNNHIPKPNIDFDAHINELKRNWEKEFGKGKLGKGKQMQKRKEELKERLIHFLDGEGDKNMHPNEEMYLDINKRVPEPNFELYTHITEIGAEWLEKQMGRKQNKNLKNLKHFENKIADKETNKKPQPNEEINVTYSEIISSQGDLNIDDNEVLNQDDILEEEEQLETKDDIIVKEENLIHTVDDDENSQPSCEKKDIYDDLNFKLFDANDTKDTSVLPDNETLAEEEQFESKDDIIIKEENLIHVVDDDETTEPNVESNKNHTENIKKCYSRQNRILPKSIEVDSSSSSSSSSDSSSSSSSSSSSDDEVEIQEVPPAEIDLTAEDDDNNKPPNNNLDKTKDISTDKSSCTKNDKNIKLKTNICTDKSSSIEINKDPTTPAVKKNINPFTPVVVTRHKRDAVYVNKKKPVPVEDKINGKNKELNIEEFDRPAKGTIKDPLALEENNEIIMQPVTKVAAGDDDITPNSTQNNTGNTVTKINVQSEDMSSSESGDDLPDCLFGLNSDIYKKDTKRAFSKNETELPKKSKISFVDKIAVNDDDGKYIEKSVDEICNAEEVKKSRGIKKRPITEFESVRRRFEAKRKKQDFSITQRYVKGKIIKSFVVPRK